jgi:hypothetical protein
MEHRQQWGVDPEEGQIIGYLLDELNIQERELVDERIRQAPAFFELVCAIEDDLMQGYLRGDLTAERRLRFEALYLTNPAKRARLDAARVLTNSLRDEALRRQARMPVLQLVPVRVRWGLAVGVLLLGVILWPSWRSRHSSQTPSYAASGPPSSASETAFYVLEPGLLRSGGGNQIELPETAQLAQFDLLASDSTPPGRYYAVLGTPEHPQMWKGAVVRRDNRLSVSIPAAVLKNADYTLSLTSGSGAQNSVPVTTYYFRVLKRAPRSDRF